MTFKLTQSEVKALKAVLEEVIQYQHMALADRLLICILTKFYKQLVVRLLDIKNRYTITIDEPTELAFYLYFEDKTCIPTDFTDNLVKSICDNIQKIHT